jgi:hypothetical protein
MYPNSILNCILARMMEGEPAIQCCLLPEMQGTVFTL